MKRYVDGGDGEAGVEFYVSHDGQFSGCLECDDDEINLNALRASLCP